MTNLFLTTSLGLIAFLIMIMSYYEKKNDDIIGIQIVSYFLYIFHYYFLNAFTAISICFINIFRNIIIIKKDKYDTLNSKYLFYLFIVLYISLGIYTYENIFSLSCIFASIINLKGLYTKDEEQIRKSGIINSLLWIIYNISVKSYIGIITQIILLILTGISYKKYKLKG